MTAQLAPTPIQKFFDNNGNPLFNGKLYSYVAGTSTPQATYTDSTMGTQNTNPVILNARGEANVWLDTTLSYKLVLQESNGTQIWSVDNIPGNGVFGTVQNIAALRNITGVGISNYQAIIVDGYTTAGDGGGGTFWWNSTSTVADNGGTIIAPTGVSTGRWYRLFQSTIIYAKIFGAKFDGVTDDTQSLQNALNYAGTSPYATLILPPGTSIITSPLVISAYTNIIGAGSWLTIINKTTNTIGTSGSSIAAPSRTGINDNYDIDSIVSVLHAPNSYTYGVSMTGIQFLGASTPNTYGIFMPRTTHTTLTDVKCQNVVNGFYTNDTWLSKFNRCLPETVTNGFVWADDGSHIGTGTSCLFDNCWINTATGIAYSIYGLTYSNFISCAADHIKTSAGTSSTSYSFLSCTGINISGCGTEDVKGTVLYFESSTSTINSFNATISIVGDTFSGTTAGVFIDSSKVVFNGSTFSSISSPGNIYNIIIQNTSEVIANNSTFPSGGNTFISYSVNSTLTALNNGLFTLTNSTTSVSYPTSTATTVGATGSATALPANPLGYLIFQVGGSNVKVPYYNN